MEYTMMMLATIVAVLACLEAASLKKQVRTLSEKVHALAQATGHEELSVWHVPDEVRLQAQALKAAGKPVAAVRIVREATGNVPAGCETVCGYPLMKKRQLVLPFFHVLRRVRRAGRRSAFALQWQ